MSRAPRHRRAPGDDAAFDVIPGRQPVREALRSGRALRWVVLDRRGGEVLDGLADQARSAGIDVRAASREELDAMAGDVRHQGVVAVAEPFAFADLADLSAAGLAVVLDGVTDPRNLGAIARVSEQAGAAGLVIRDKRAAGPSPAAEKAAAGALSWLPVVKVTNISRALGSLRDGGMWTIGLSEGADTTVWDQPLMDERVAIVVGEEGRGLTRLVAEQVDVLVSIPMSGHLDSLNASTATAVVAFEWRRRHISRAGA